MFLNNVIFHFYVGGGGSVTVMSKNRSCPLVAAKGMSRSAGHCFLSNVKLQGLEDRWFRGLTKIRCQLFCQCFYSGGGGGVKRRLTNVIIKWLFFFKASLKAHNSLWF